MLSLLALNLSHLGRRSRMTTIPKRLNDTVALIDRAHESKLEQPRAHLGCSGLGHHCDRYIWLSFRWAVIEKFSGRMLRLFRRGQLEEEQIITDLRLAGISIGGDQMRVDFGCHVSGSVDGIIKSGVPEATNTRHVAEFKTHSLKSFKALVKDGVVKSKPMHYAQMQLYMWGLGLDRALYVAVCKNDDTYYTARFELDREYSQKLVEKGHKLALADRIPSKISDNPSWYQCKMCSYSDFCHYSKTTKEINCRTCAHSTAKDDSTFYCEKYQDTIPYEHQVKGCDAHVLHPDMVPWELVAGQGSKYVAAYRVDDDVVLNGEGHFKSRELIANAQACTMPDLIKAREIFDGEIVG